MVDKEFAAAAAQAHRASSRSWLHGLLLLGLLVPVALVVVVGTLIFTARTRALREVEVARREELTARAQLEAQRAAQEAQWRARDTSHAAKGVLDGETAAGSGGAGMGSSLPMPGGGAAAMGGASSAPGEGPMIGLANTPDYLVRIEVDLGGFPRREVTGLVVEQRKGWALVVTAAAALRPVAGKLNGRPTNAIPQGITIVPITFAGGSSGMPGMGMMGSGSGLMRGMGGRLVAGIELKPMPRIVADAGTGLVLFAVAGDFPPIRMWGELPRARVGDRLLVVSAAEAPVREGESRVTELTVLEELAKFPRDSLPSPSGPEQALLKVSAWPGPVGAMLYNSQAQVVGQIVATVDAQPGQPAHALAVPIDGLFQMVHTTMEQSLKLLTDEADQSAGGGEETGAAGGTKILGDGVSAPTSEELKWERETQNLALRVRSASGDEQQTLRKELQTLVAQHFAFRQKKRQAEIDDLTRRVEQLRGRHDRRNTKQTEIIQARLQQLLGESSSLPWDEVDNAGGADEPADVTRPDHAAPASEPTQERPRN